MFSTCPSERACVRACSARTDIFSDRRAVDIHSFSTLHDQNTIRYEMLF